VPDLINNAIGSIGLRSHANNDCVTAENAECGTP
jgi:hypothetical protein